jgi:hypothetical protein
MIHSLLSMGMDGKQVTRGESDGDWVQIVNGKLRGMDWNVLPSGSSLSSNKTAMKQRDGLENKNQNA